MIKSYKHKPKKAKRCGIKYANSKQILRVFRLLQNKYPLPIIPADLQPNGIYIRRGYIQNVFNTLIRIGVVEEVSVYVPIKNTHLVTKGYKFIPNQRGISNIINQPL